MQNVAAFYTLLGYFCYGLLAMPRISAQVTFAPKGHTGRSADSTRIQLVPPLDYLRVNSSFGPRIHPVTQQFEYHEGVDLAARCDLVYAVGKGIVMETGFNPLLGRYIKIDHVNFISVYGHLSHIFLTSGTVVNTGQIIALTGSTGRVTGSHLHFAIIKDHRYINPLQFLLLCSQ